MSSEFFRRPSLLPKLVMMVGAAALLSACQVRPLYSEAAGTGAKLADIAFTPADDRVEQVVRNRLIFLTSGGEGEPRLPQYQVALNVVAAYSDILDDEDAVGLQPGRVVVTGTYTLTRIKDASVLKTGSRRVTALLDVSSQEFAELRAVRDAEERAGRELAEFIRADLAIALAEEPQPQVTWQK
ncbi:LPS-assembly lipoprotein [Pseudorhizobium tarimense]|uniref:LPS-assembly lipoprotein n=2 Tax=Pseudorhizobium tarimense TaxID=1079109 RepID=A0ABV2H880_9HYPH